MKVVCAECDSTLEAVIEDGDMRVQPCPQCLSTHYDEGYGDALRERGYDFD